MNRVYTFQWWKNERCEELVMCGKPAAVVCGDMGACNQHSKERIWWNCVRDSGGTVTRVPSRPRSKTISGDKA